MPLSRYWREAVLTGQASADALFSPRAWRLRACDILHGPILLHIHGFRSTLTGLSANPYQYGGWSLLKDASPQNGWAGLNGYSDCRGHFGGLLGGALTAYLLGPRLERVKRKGGHTLQDNPPIPLFASKL